MVLLGILVETPAKAYTDPGTGALLWQMLVALFAGCLFYVRKFSFWFKNRKKPRE